jgi:hypothetical protein
MTPHEAETGMSFFITKAQKAELRRRDYSEEQIREMTPGDAHRALGLIGASAGRQRSGHTISNRRWRLKAEEVRT